MAEPKRRRDVVRCYVEREWVTITLPPEAARGMDVARRRVRGLRHELAFRSLEDVLVAAYLQGVIDGDQVAEHRRAKAIA